MVKINHNSSKARASILLLGTAIALVAHAEAAVLKRQSNETTTLNGTEINENVLRRNCAYFGWYLDDGNTLYGSQGEPQTLAEINAAVGKPAYSWGAYDHIEADNYVPGDPSTYYNGSEILPYLQPAINAKDTVFVASIAPVHGFDGFQANDTAQLDAMVGVIKQFVDGGVTVWLRFAHEFNWYYRRGSDDHDPTGRRSYHDPSPANFLTSWRLVYNTFKRELPTVQHMWCANVGGMDEIRQFWPGEEYVDIVALDYYTELGAPRSQYLYPDGLIKQTHDTFALAYDKPFWMGETGTRTNSTVNNLQWIDTITSERTCASMPNYEGVMYFNYIKNYIDHYVAVPGGSNVTTQFAELFNATPGDPTTLQSTVSAATPGGELAYNLEHLRRRLTT